MNPLREDFTEGEYQRLLKLAANRWRFIGFRDARDAGESTVLWRHDVDFSPQRALRLAQLEADLGVKATYFILLNSNFYNALEPAIATIFASIRDLGHDIGLHFDPSAHSSRASGEADMLSALRLDKRIIEEYFRVAVEAFSYHNPDIVPGGIPEEDLVDGMVNAYGNDIRRRFSYVSDSNGYWRYRTLSDVLTTGSESRLHVLTHPEWWTPESMPPRARVTRCIDGRANRQRADYDHFLEAHGRLNVR